MKLLKLFKPKVPKYRKNYPTYDRGMDTEAQGGIWLSQHPNKFEESNTALEVDFDKITGIKK